MGKWEEEFLRGALTGAGFENHDLQGKLSRAQQEANRTSQDIAALNLALRERNEKIQRLEAHIAELDKALDGWKAYANKTEEDYKRLRGIIEQAREECDDHIADKHSMKMELAKTTDLASQHYNRALVMQAYAESLGQALGYVTKNIFQKPFSEWPAVLNPDIYGQGDAYLVDATQRAKLREKYGDEVTIEAVSMAARCLEPMRSAAATFKRAHQFNHNTPRHDKDDIWACWENLGQEK
ncbi:MAG TPA: hypothetical protein VEB64_12135 [Azospirillaceae bacterium]|nr:hypothetical protein [Azospirillaceae bacterium]